MNIRRFPLGPLWTNGFLIDDGHGIGLFVDPGGEVSDVLNYLKAKSIKLELIILTHGHGDHILGVKELKDATGAKLMINAKDAPMLLDVNLNHSDKFGHPVSDLKPDVAFGDGYSFQVGNIHGEAIETSGHTPGSSCFLLTQDNQKVLVAGDTLFAGSIGRTDLPGGDSRAMGLSLQKLVNMEGDMQILPGHGPETTLEEERKRNPFLQSLK